VRGVMPHTAPRHKAKTDRSFPRSGKRNRGGGNVCSPHPPLIFNVKRGP